MVARETEVPYLARAPGTRRQAAAYKVVHRGGVLRMRLRDNINRGIEIVDDRSAEMGDREVANVRPGIGPLGSEGVVELPWNWEAGWVAGFGNVLTKKKIDEKRVTVNARIRIVPRTSETPRLLRSARARCVRCFDGRCNRMALLPPIMTRADEPSEINGGAAYIEVRPRSAAPTGPARTEGSAHAH